MFPVAVPENDALTPEGNRIQLAELISSKRFDASTPPCVTDRRPQSTITGNDPALISMMSPDSVWIKVPAVEKEKIWLNKVAFPGGLKVVAKALVVSIEDCQ